MCRWNLFKVFLQLTSGGVLGQLGDAVGVTWLGYRSCMEQRMGWPGVSCLLLLFPPLSAFLKFRSFPFSLRYGTKHLAQE